jgi:hypothetical protein
MLVILLPNLIKAITGGLEASDAKCFVLHEDDKL